MRVIVKHIKGAWAEVSKGPLSFTILTLALIKKGAESKYNFQADGLNFISYCRSILTGRIINPLKETKHTKQFISNDFSYDNDTAYKFIKPLTFGKYILNGNFRLGTLPGYRIIENEKARDELEGWGHVHISAQNRDLTSVMIGER